MVILLVPMLNYNNFWTRFIYETAINLIFCDKKIATGIILAI